MNSNLYASYVPAINAFLNPIADTVCKSWEEVVKVFFTLNEDEVLSSKSNLALSFKGASHPNYFLVNAKSIEGYFQTFKISSKSLTEEGFKNEDGFIEDVDLRLSFSTFRWIVFRKGDFDLVKSFDFIDKIFQMYVRYELAMMNKSRRPTHWTIFQQIDKFSKLMQPHIDFKVKEGKEPSFRSMDTQPEVYCIVKGTLKSILARIAKYTKLDDMAECDENAESSKISPEPVIPVYESVLSNVEEEIAAFLGHLNENYVQEYRLEQVGKTGSDGTVIENISGTKFNVKTSKSLILIDSEQDKYTSKMLANDVEFIRSKLKRGEFTHTKKLASKKKEKEETENYVSIDLFEESNGAYIDAAKLYKLNPRDDGNVSLVGKVNATGIAKSSIDSSETESEDIQMDGQRDAVLYVQI